ncbi:hypothetical protein GCM10023215_19570 [Pseudonocardia yuanmonensis]|uniref:Acyl-CoA dehydrogenase/oxidase C-terminal domain-containing protein n=1 Tax=Pseudonocardia yuanmonensis TaxID=1095914 RepID=A0ABP8WCA4_9PSEU
MVFARTDPDTAGTARGISAFLVEAGTSGLFVGPRDKKMGQAGAWTAEVVLDEVRVSTDALVGAEGAGFRTAMKSLARGRLHVAALCVGLADRILEETAQAAATIRQGGRAIGEFQLVQAHLAESEAELYAGRAMVLEAARAYDAGEDMTPAPSSAKLFCSEMLGRVADRGVQVHGGMGYMRSVPVERFYRDARLFRIYEGTSDPETDHRPAAAGRRGGLRRTSWSCWRGGPPSSPEGRPGSGWRSRAPSPRTVPRS